MNVAAFDLAITRDHDITTHRGKLNCSSSGLSCQDSCHVLLVVCF